MRSQSAVLKRDSVANFGPLTFPEWVPAAVVEVGKQLHAELATKEDPAKALEVLSRLLTAPRMKLVWQELCRKKNTTRDKKEFLHPACVTNASWAAVCRQRACELRKQGDEISKRDAQLLQALEAEAAELDKEKRPTNQKWTEQERALQLFVWRVYRTALDCKPVYLSEILAQIKELREMADLFRKRAPILESYGMKREARKLKAIAEACEEEVFGMDPAVYSLDENDPWILIRRTDNDLLRAFVIDLSLTTLQLFRKTLYSTLANVTNAVFSPQENITDEEVREILRVRLRPRPHK